MKKAKKVKAFWSRESQDSTKSTYAYATKFQMFKYKVGVFFTSIVKCSLYSSLIFGAMYASFQAGQSLFPTTLYAIQEKIVFVEIDSSVPVLERIAQCESKKSHYCTEELIKGKNCSKNEKGQVLVRANTKSVDIGYFQINSIWGGEASKQGLNLYNEEDNKKFANWLYQNRGTEDWYPSKGCWSK